MVFDNYYTLQKCFKTTKKKWMEENKANGILNNIKFSHWKFVMTHVEKH